MSLAEQIGRASGVIRSLAVYHAIPGRQRRLRQLYALFAGPGDLTFDLGAHVGNRTRALAALGCRVISLEPQADFAWLLRLFFARQSNVSVIEAAVGGHAGRAVMAVSDRTPTMTTVATEWRNDRQHDPLFSKVHWNRRVDVEQVSLDTLIARFGLPTFIKIDVEGAEPQVLSGLTHPVTALSFEYLPHALNYTQTCVEMLLDLGPYQFNWSAGESYELASSRWMSGDEVISALGTTPAQLQSGDVYARLDRSVQGTHSGPSPKRSDTGEK